MYFHPSFLRVEMIERLFTQTYAAGNAQRQLLQLLLPKAAKIAKSEFL